MYLYKNPSSQLPQFRPPLSEPKVLMTWANNVPFNSMSDAYGLSEMKGMTWMDHLMDQIVIPNSDGATILAQSLNKTERLFDEWIASSREPSRFASVPLQHFVNTSGRMAALMLVEDVYCVECDQYDPAYIFLGENGSSRSFHPQYESIAAAFSRPLFDEEPEFATCFICDPQNRFITPSMARGNGRRKMGSCECMPCRGRL